MVNILEFGGVVRRQHLVGELVVGSGDFHSVVWGRIAVRFKLRQPLQKRDMSMMRGDAGSCVRADSQAPEFSDRATLA